MDEVKNQTDLAEYQVGDAQDKKRKYSQIRNISQSIDVVRRPNVCLAEVPECKRSQRRKKYRIEENIPKLKKYSIFRLKGAIQTYPGKISELLV